MPRITQAPPAETVHAIPTEYGGINFRSRLEARWAAFFDLARWQWDYEPVDFNGWIPDFVLIGTDQITFVEVKPVYVFPFDVAAKIDASGCGKEVLIVGAGNPIRVRGTHCGPGWLREQEGPVEGEWMWGAAPYGRWDANPSGYGFCSADCSYRDRISGGYDGGSWGGVSDEDIDLTITAHWREAANLTQWGRDTHRLRRINEIHP